MKDKYDAVNEIYTRIKNKKSIIGIETFKFAEESTDIQENKLACIFLGYGEDLIVQYSTRSYFGYPATRLAQVFVELVCKSDDDIQGKFDKLRAAIFTDCKVSDSGIIRELKNTGITNYNMPNIKAQTLVLGLHYIDKGV